MGRLDREGRGLGIEQITIDETQGRVVVEDVDPPAEGACHQIVLAALNLQIAKGDGRDAAVELHPVSPPSMVTKRPNSVPAKSRPSRSSSSTIDQTTWRSGQISGDGRQVRPRSWLLRRYGLKSPLLWLLKAAYTVSGSLHRRREIGDIGVLGNTGEAADRPPVLAAVLGHLDEPVVGPDIDQTLHQRRFVEGDDVAVERGEDVLPHRIDAPHPAHDLELIAVDPAGEIGAHGAPGVAAVIGAEEPVAGEIEPAARSAEMMMSGESQCQRMGSSPASGWGWISTISPLSRS